MITHLQCEGSQLVPSNPSQCLGGGGEWVGGRVCERVLRGSVRRCLGGGVEWVCEEVGW